VAEEEAGEEIILQIYRGIYLCNENNEISVSAVCFWRTDTPALKAVADGFLFTPACMVIVSIQVLAGWLILCKTGELGKF